MSATITASLERFFDQATDVVELREYTDEELGVIRKWCAEVLTARALHDLVIKRRVTLDVQDGQMIFKFREGADSR